MTISTATGLSTSTPAAPSASPAQVIEWLRTLEPAPYTPPAVHMEQDVADNGDLFVCSHGNTLALIFHGTLDFIYRWHAWAQNTSVIGRNARLNWYVQGQTGALAYVCPKTRDHILRGLALQFRWEIKRSGQVPPLVNRWDDEREEQVVEYDETLIARMAAARARAFFKEHVRPNFQILQRAKDLAPVYEMAPTSCARTGTAD